MRRIITYGGFFEDFMETLSINEQRKVDYVTPKNYRFYVRGIGPNGVPEETGMISLQAPNGGIPGLKSGNKLNYK